VNAFRLPFLWNTDWQTSIRASGHADGIADIWHIAFGPGYGLVPRHIHLLELHGTLICRVSQVTN
jgi:hypothetical protein